MKTIHTLAFFIALTLNLASCASSSTKNESISVQAKDLAHSINNGAKPSILPYKLRFPVRGHLNTDYFFTNYVDHATKKGSVLDSNCGIKTYDGHQGTDIAISDFKAMEQGVEVLAAADGIVYKVHDGEFDRHNVLKKSTHANFVNIHHAGGLTTLYYHLKKDSITVKEGDSIKAGDVLGLVGSSGFSSGPHLHFATYINGKLVDPFSGACNQKASLWESEEKYDTTFRVWASGITTETEVNSQRLKESLAHEPTVSISAERVTFWVHFLNAPENQNISFRFIRPDGSLYSLYKGQSEKYKPDGWFWGYTKVVDTDMTRHLGRWTVEFAHEGKVLASSTFMLVE